MNPKTGECADSVNAIWIGGQFLSALKVEPMKPMVMYVDDEVFQYTVAGVSNSLGVEVRGMTARRKLGN